VGVALSGDGPLRPGLDPRGSAVRIQPALGVRPQRPAAVEPHRTTAPFAQTGYPPAGRFPVQPAPSATQCDCREPPDPPSGLRPVSSYRRYAAVGTAIRVLPARPALAGQRDFPGRLCRYADLTRH